MECPNRRRLNSRRVMRFRPQIKPRRNGQGHIRNGQCCWRSLDIWHCRSGGKGEKRAGNFAPVMDDRVSVDWINQVVASRTSPPIRSIEINSIEIDSGGRIFVLDIPQGDTAHQSLFSHVYHQRIGAQVMPMQDFQIRDVMNRRSGPVLEISLSREPKSKNMTGTCTTSFLL